MSYKEYDINNLDSRSTYLLLNRLIVPRPIAWVSTLSKNGVSNLAPFSFFNVACASPAVLMLSFGYKEDGKKDTLNNILETQKLVINIANFDLLESVVSSASEYSVSEFEALNIPIVKAKLSDIPTVANVPVKLECSLYQEMKLGDSPDGAILIFAQAELVHVNENIIVNDKVSYDLYNPIARLGGISYGRVTDQRNITIPELK